MTDTPSPSRAGERLPLVERLQTQANYCREKDGSGKLYQEAADALRTAEQERDALRREANGLIEAAFNADAEAASLQAQLIARDQTIAQLREVLIKVRAHTSYISPWYVADRMKLLAGLA